MRKIIDIIIDLVLIATIVWITLKTQNENSQLKEERIKDKKEIIRVKKERNQYYNIAKRLTFIKDKYKSSREFAESDSIYLSLLNQLD